MGQAFDGDGNVLGEAHGETKREVFEKLHKEHADAAEIRIKPPLLFQHPLGTFHRPVNRTMTMRTTTKPHRLSGAQRFPV